MAYCPSDGVSCNCGDGEWRCRTQPPATILTSQEFARALLAWTGRLHIALPHDLYDAARYFAEELPG